MTFTLNDIKKIAIIWEKKTYQYDITQANLDSIRAVLPEAEIIVAPNEEELLKKTTDADLLIVWFGNTPRTFCKNAPSLKWVHSLVAGVDHIMIPEITERDVIITNTSGIQADPISEFVLALILNKLKGLSTFARQQEQRIWYRTWIGEIKGSTVLVLGLGKIGKEIARKCKLLGFNVIGYKRRYEEFEYVDELCTDPKELNTVLAKADFVVCSLPGSPETKNMLDREQFMAMKKGAYFINVGRGITVNQNALIWALESGAISGCALDTCTPEPLPADSPLWKLQNVVITPHISADTPYNMDRTFDKLLENLEHLKNGEPMKYRIK